MPTESEHALSAINENVPGIVFHVGIEPDGDFRFLSMTTAGLVAMGFDRSRVVGARVRDVIPSSSRELMLNHFHEAIRTRRTIRWRDVSEYPAGTRVGDVAVTAVYDADGMATHVIGVVHDITEQQQLNEALRQREERQSFLLRLNDALQPLSDPVERQEAAARLLAEHLQVNRVCYADIGEDDILRYTYAGGVTPSRERGPVSSLGRVLLAAYERWGIAVVGNVAADPRFSDDERAILLAGGISAFAGVLIRKNTGRKGAFGVHNSTAREWTPSEVTLIQDVAERA